MANKRRPQGDGTIRKRSDGRWEGRIVIGHKKDGTLMYKSVFGKTQKSALQQLQHQIQLYRDVNLTEESRMTLGEWLDRWIDEYMIFTLRETTLDGYRSQIKYQIKRFIGNKQLASLTTADIQKFYNRIKKEGRVRNHPVYGTALSDAMVRSVHKILHQALDVAVRERLIVRNPTVGTTLPKKNYAEKQVLDDGQFRRFMEAIQGDPYWYPFFYLEIMTGLRRGEICGLRWEDMNFSDGTLCVRRSVTPRTQGTVHVGETKTNAGKRTMILPPSVADLLKKIKTDSVSEWIFPYYRNPSEPLHPDLAYRRLKSILKEAKLPSIRFHDLRHTFATRAIKSGVDAKALAGILGHTNASFTLDTYTHVTGDMQRNASSVVDRMMQKFLIKEDENGKR